MSYQFYKNKTPEAYCSKIEECDMQEYPEIEEIFKMFLEAADSFAIDHVFQYGILEKYNPEILRKIEVEKLYFIGYCLFYEEQRKEYHKESWIRLFKYYIEKLEAFYIYLPQENSQKYLEYFSGIEGISIKENFVKEHEFGDYSREEHVAIYGGLKGVKDMLYNIMMKEYFDNDNKDRLVLNLFNIKDQKEGTFALVDNGVYLELTDEMYKRFSGQGIKLGTMIEDHHRIFCKGDLDDELRKALYLIQNFNSIKQEQFPKEEKPFYTNITLYKNKREIFRVNAMNVFICIPEEEEETYKRILKRDKWEKYNEKKEYCINDSLVLEFF